MTLFFALIGLSVFFMAVAFAVAINTSMGGTRSDYNDCSGFLMAIATALFVFGVYGLLVEVFGS